jgi:hypothetical protein
MMTFVLVLYLTGGVTTLQYPTEAQCSQAAAAARAQTMTAMGTSLGAICIPGPDLFGALGK